MKFLSLTIALLLTLSPISAFSAAYAIGKLGYYRPTSSVLREINGQAWMCFGAEASGNFSETNPALKRTYVVGKANYTRADGQSIGLRNSSRIQMVPLSLGPRVLEAFNNVAVPFDLFAGIGANYTYVHVRNDSLVAKSNVNVGGFGGYGEVGAFIRPKEHFVIELIASYSYSPISPPSGSKACKKHTVDVGGLLIEMGFGYKH